MLCFQSTQEGSLREKFLAVKQEGIVADFRRTFDALAAPVQGMMEEVLEATFIKGLKTEIRAEVCLLCPKGLDQLMDVAQRIEDHNNITKLAREDPAQENTPTSFSPNQNEGRKTEFFPTRSVMVEEWTTTPRREYPSRKMSNAEWQLQREKGLCFRCDKKYTMGHQCKNRELKVLLVQEDEHTDQEKCDLSTKEQPIEVAERVNSH